MVLEENFLRLTVTVRLQKNEYFKKIFFFQHHQYCGQPKIFQNLYFTLLDLSLKKLNLTM